MHFETSGQLLLDGIDSSTGKLIENDGGAEFRFSFYRPHINIYPGTLVSLKFGGWIDGKDSAAGWEGVLTNINVDAGVVEVGDPRATTFGRLLTVFF